MGRIILHHKGAYNFYSTISDGACFEEALTEKQVEQFIKEEYGNQGLEKLPSRLERAHAKGTSDFHHTSLKEQILCNRAGKNEKHLSLKKFIKQFLTLK